MSDTSEAKAPSKSDRAAAALIDALFTAIDEGMGPLEGAKAYASGRLDRANGDVEAAIRRVVRETIVTSTAAGFVTGIGGLATLPVTLPANLAGQAILNARMVATIAHLRGWDLEDEFVRSAIVITVAGGQPMQVFQQFAVQVSTRAATSAIRSVPITLIREINKRAGFMLVAKYGTKRSAVTLTKAVPVVGGVVGGGVDGTFTKFVSTAAKRSFPVSNISDGRFHAVVE